MVSKRMNLNRNVASQARMMPLIKCCAASSGGLTAKTTSVAKGYQADGKPADKQVSEHRKAFKKSKNAIIASRTNLV